MNISSLVENIFSQMLKDSIKVTFKDDFKELKKGDKTVLSEPAEDETLEKPEVVDIEEQEAPPKEAAPQEAPPKEMPMQGDPSMAGMDPSMQDPSMAGGMGMGFGEDPNKPTTPKEVGRLYELKKIHARISAIDMYLSSKIDQPDLNIIKEKVVKSTDLFHTVISNFGLYKEKIDEIIVEFYSFLLEVYTELQDNHNKNKKDKNLMGGS